MSKVIQHKMKFEVVMMTPERAQELLDHNHPKNRKPKPYKIEQYVREMRQGYWELTPEPICVDLDGWLINGQNRLTAVVRSDCEVPMTLVTGCPTRSLQGMDQGSVRNFADYARISTEGLPHLTASGGGAYNVAAVIRAMQNGIGGLRRTSLTNAEVVVLANNYADALSFCFECLPKNQRGITQSPVRAVIARAYFKRNFRNRTRQFCTMLYDGLVEDAKRDSGVVRLRNWLIESFLGGLRKQRAIIRVKPTVVYAKTERALEAFHAGEYIQSLIERKQELFPLPDEKDYEPEESPNGVLVES